MTGTGDFRDDPDWRLAQAEYLFPDADDADEKFAYRVLAAFELRKIGRRYAVWTATT